MIATVSKPSVKVLTQKHGQNWSLYNADCCEAIKAIPDNSIHYSIFSPPFGTTLYVYNASERDMGNGRSYIEFARHFGFLAKELQRVIMPGRLVSMHCMDIPLMKERDGEIGLFDFPGSLTRMMQRNGFVKHSEVTIWKDPVMAVQRTKALGLLHKQLKKDSAWSRQGIPDKLITFRKRGDNPERVTKTNESFPVDKWQDYASPVWRNLPDPVWMDIRTNDTLGFIAARDGKDERHICPTQLTVLERGIELWTNPGDIVLDPFNGIGSTGWVSLKNNRRYIGFELKESYFSLAAEYLSQFEENSQMSLF